MNTVQINCPNCNGANAPEPNGQYECIYCLQPFSVQQAEREDQRLLEELRAWMQQKVGAAGLNMGGVDAASRAFIFKDKILPNLQRDVNRSLETLGGHGQFPLVLPPIPVNTGRGTNPLLAERKSILGLRGLQARLKSPEIITFVTNDLDKATVQEMERRVTDLIHLSNVAQASTTRDAINYRSIRANVESVLTEVNESLATAGARDPSLAGFLAVAQVRYRSALDLARVFEHLCSPNPISGAEVAQRVQQLADNLASYARQLETLDHDPVVSMPMVTGVDLEVAACRLLLRWLDAYDTMTAKVQRSFHDFVAEALSLVGPRANEPGHLCELLEEYTDFFKVARGEKAVAALDDHGWVDGWAESQRKKKDYGLLGDEEVVDRIDLFLLPVWITEVHYAQRSGGVFAQGAERVGVAMVDACAPTPAGVFFAPDRSDHRVAGLAYPKPLHGQPLALPASTGRGADPIIVSALQSRPDVNGTRLTGRSLGFVSAAAVTFRIIPKFNQNFVVVTHPLNILFILIGTVLVVILTGAAGAAWGLLLLVGVLGAEIAGILLVPRTDLFSKHLESKHLAIESARRSRTVVTALAGQLGVTPQSRLQLQAATELLQRFN